MATEYEDPVRRTKRLYSKEIDKAASELRIETPNMGVSFDYALLLEAKVKERTKDPKAKLVRSALEEQMLIEIAIARAKVAHDMQRGRMN